MVRGIWDLGSGATWGGVYEEFSRGSCFIMAITGRRFLINYQTRFCWDIQVLLFRVLGI